MGGSFWAQRAREERRPENRCVEVNERPEDPNFVKFKDLDNPPTSGASRAN